jgi:hypothetical protein
MPDLKPDAVLVRVSYSAISASTEMMKIQTAKMNLLKKARSKLQREKQTYSIY